MKVVLILSLVRIIANKIIAMLNTSFSFSKRRLGVESQSPQSSKKGKVSPQRKTTLKWSTDGELSSIDMTRILDKLARSELTKCDLACDLDDLSKP